MSCSSHTHNSHKFFFSILTVSGVVHSMQLYPLEEVLTAPYLVSEWRPDLIEDLQKELSPYTCRIVVVGQKVEPIADTIEKWYGTKYHWEKLDKNVLEVNFKRIIFNILCKQALTKNLIVFFDFSCRNGQIVVSIQNYRTRIQTHSSQPTSICIQLKRMFKKFRSSFTIHR